MALDKSLNDFIGFLEKKGRSKSTMVAYKKDIDQLLIFLNQDKNIDSFQDLSTDLLEEYVEKIKESGEYTLKTVSRKINSLKTYFKHLHKEGLIVKDFAKPVNHPNYTQQPPRVLSPLEYRALRDTARVNSRLYTMVELLLQTGIRIGELSRLQLSDVDIEKGVITVSEFSSNPKREVELNDQAISAIRKYQKSLPEDQEHLFQTKTGKPVLIRNIRTAINRAFKKAGIKNATVNDIRNTFIVFQLENGMKLERLAELVGHQKPTTTEKYLELVEERPKRTNSRIEIL